MRLFPSFPRLFTLPWISRVGEDKLFLKVRPSFWGLNASAITGHKEGHAPQRIQVPSFGLIHKKTLFDVSTDDQKCRVCFINGENFLIIQAALNAFFCFVHVRFLADFCRFLFVQRKFRVCGFGRSEKRLQSHRSSTAPLPPRNQWDLPSRSHIPWVSPKSHGTPEFGRRLDRLIGPKMLGSAPRFYFVASARPAICPIDIPYISYLIPPRRVGLLW